MIRGSKDISGNTPDHNRHRSIASGGFAVSGGEYFEADGCVLAEIRGYDDSTNTYKIVTYGNKRCSGVGKESRSHVGVTRRQSDEADHVVLSSDKPILVDYSLGVPIIVGVLPASARRLVEGGAPTVAPDLGGLDTGSTAINENADGYAVTENKPKNMLPSDKMFVSPDGNYIGALRGKVTKIYGSERAQTLVLGLHDLIRTITENYEHFSSLGELQIQNKNGRSSLSFRAAADQLYESGGAEKNWTYRLDIGSDGQLFDMRITTPDNASELAQLKYGPDGSTTIFSAASMSRACAQDYYDEVGGNDYKRTLGNKQEFVAGNTSFVTNSSQTINVSGSYSRKVGGNDSVSIIGNSVRSFGGRRVVTVTGGSVSQAKPSNNAMEYNVVNGSYVMHLGHPQQQAVPSALAGFKVYTYSGGPIIFGESPTPAGSPQATVSLNTLKANSIGLGCIVPGPYSESSANPPKDSAMLFNKWQSWAKEVIKLLHQHETAFLSHVHKSTAPGAPTGTTEYPAGSPAITVNFNALNSLITPVKSIRVMMGG